MEKKEKKFTMHEFKQFVYNGLQKFPVSSQKPWILPHYVHYVGSNDSFVVLATFLLTQAEKILK